MKRRCCFSFFIATTLDEKGNSLGDFYVGIANELVRRGHHVAFITDGQKTHLEDHQSNPAVYTWPSRRPIHLRDAIFLSKLIAVHRPHCIVANYGAVNWCVAVGWLRRVPIRVVFAHTPSRQLQLDYPQSPLKFRFLHFRKRMVYKLATHCFTATTHVLQDLVANYGVPRDKITRLPFLLPDPLKTFKPTGCDPNKISYVGRFYRSKGQDCMIRALPAILREFPEVHVDFIGEGPTLQSCLELATSLGVRRNCNFLGRLADHRQIYRNMSESWLAVAASHDEGFGLVLLEDLSVGTPVIATNIPAISEFVVDGRHGFLIPPGTHAALAEKVLILMRNKALREEFSRNAREDFCRYHSLEANAGRHADVFETLANQPMLAASFGKNRVM